MGGPGNAVGGRYVLHHRLGGGATAEVWAARDLELDRAVALKLLAPTADAERFQREARAAAALQHENITRLFAYGEEGDSPYIVLEYLPGGTLEDRLAGGERLDPARAERLAAGVAAGLAHAHEQGIVHRDLKPANILFDPEGRPKIADFGIARLTSADRTLTEAGTVLGTAAYISPEQAAGLPAGPASDVYSFGVVLYRMLTGRLPFASDDPLELARLHRDAPPPGIHSLPEAVPASLAALLVATLAKSPADRPPDGAALVAALDGAATQPRAAPAPAAAPTTVLRRSPAAPPPRRAGRRTLAAVLLTMLAGGGAALAWAVTRQPATATPATRTGATGTGALVLPRESTAQSTGGAPGSSTAPAAETLPSTTSITTRPVAAPTRATTRATPLPPPPPPPTTSTSPPFPTTTTAVTTGPGTVDTTTDTTSTGTTAGG